MPFKVQPPQPLENVFLELARSGEQSVGYWGGQLTEDFGVVARNFPYVLLDREHNNMTMDFVTQARDAMRAAGSNSTLIVRVREPEAREAQGVLDSGAQGVMFPMINTAEQAKHAVALCKYPSQGIRGMGYSNAQSRYGLHADYVSQANANTAVIAQIETEESLENAESIITTPGLSAVFFGPADMAASLGHTGNSGHPDVQAAADKILKICNKKGVPCGTLTNSFENAQKRLDQGFNYVFPDYDENIRRRAIEETAILFLGYMPK